MKLKIYILLLLTLTITASAQLSMPKVFSSHMVLQRDMEIPGWGNAVPGSEVQVQFDNNVIKDWRMKRANGWCIYHNVRQVGRSDW